MTSNATTSDVSTKLIIEERRQFHILKPHCKESKRNVFRCPSAPEIGSSQACRKPSSPAQRGFSPGRQVAKRQGVDKVHHHDRRERKSNAKDNKEKMKSEGSPKTTKKDMFPSPQKHENINIKNMFGFGKRRTNARKKDGPNICSIT